MPLRWKLLILLLLLALVPLAIMRAFGLSSARRIGRELAAEERAALTDDAERLLLQVVEDHSRLLQYEARTFEQALRIQARESERCLQADVPADSAVFFAEAFERRDPSLPGLKPSNKHGLTVDGDRRVPMDVSYEAQSFLAAPGIAAPQVADDAARLSRLLPTLQLLSETNPMQFYWQFIGLENGLHSSFPGHGRYPQRYDHRLRDWYVTTRSNPTLQWHTPMVDASSREVVMSVSMPVYRNNTLAGVTGIDVCIADLIHTVELPDVWEEEARVMMVVPTQIEPGTTKLLILIQQAYLSNQRRWDMPVELSFLETPDHQVLAQLIADMQADRSGVQGLSLDGVPSICAYGPLQVGDSHLLVSLPQETIVAPAVAAEQRVLAKIDHQLNLTRGILLAVVVAVVAAALISSRHVTAPIRELTRAARAVADGRLNTATQVRSADEIGELSNAFNRMVPQLQDRLKIRQSLDVAMEVQQSLLPTASPTVAGLDIAGRSIYCDETGGDYYDFLEYTALGPHHLGLAVGDVSGHGIAAALLMATARGLLRGQVDNPGNLAQLLNSLNRHLCIQTLEGRFMTLFYAILDTQQRTLRWSSAGHDPAICYDPTEGSFTEFEGDVGIPLGVLPQWEYVEEGPANLRPGQVIVIGTDGIWETRNSREDMFGKPALREMIRAHAGQSAEEIAQAITTALSRFRESHPQEDDVTLVVVKIL